MKSPVAFERISIVGLGLIGGSLASALKTRQTAATVVGVDKASVLEHATKLGLIHEGFEPGQLGDAVGAADLVVLATPISSIIELLPTVASNVQKGALITDVGSTKEAIVASARECLSEGTYFLGGHPMTGSEKGGLKNADAALFWNSVYALTPDGLVKKELVQKFVALVKGIGAEAYFLSASEHDRVVAVTSHLPQLLATTLMNCATREGHRNQSCLDLAAGGFRDMTRIGSSPFEIWKDIFSTNRANIDAAVDEFIVRLRELKQSMGGSELESIFKLAAEHRTRLATRKGSRTQRSTRANG